MKYRKGSSKARFEQGKNEEKERFDEEMWKNRKGRSIGKVWPEKEEV